MSNESHDWDEFAGEAPAPPSPVPTRERTGFRWGLFFGLLLIGAIAVLAAQNTQTVRLRILGWDGNAPLIVIMLFTAVIAVVIDELIGVMWRIRRRRLLAEREELRRLRSERPVE
jgi:uncharacterized integral membrane protein